MNLRRLTWSLQLLGEIGCQIQHHLHASFVQLRLGGGQRIHPLDSERQVRGESVSDVSPEALDLR